MTSKKIFTPNNKAGHKNNIKQPEENENSKDKDNFQDFMNPNKNNNFINENQNNSEVDINALNISIENEKITENSIQKDKKEPIYP